MHDVAESAKAELASLPPWAILVLAAAAGVVTRLAVNVASSLTWRRGFRAGLISAELRDPARPVDREA